MKKKGFTIIELMVVIALFGVLITVLTPVVIQAIQGANRASIQNEVRQNAQKVFSDLGTEIRKASCLTYSSSGTTNTLSTYSDSGCVNSVATYTSDGGAKTFTKTIGAFPPINLLSTQVAPVSCGVSGSSCGTASCTTNGFTVTGYDGSPIVGNYPNAVKVTLTVQQTPGQTRSDFC